VVIKSLLSSTYFSVDYRSFPSGIGHISYESGDVVLVTEAGSGPQDLAEAREMILEDHWPSAVNNIPFHMGEYWDEGQAALKAILCTHQVEYVIDTELAYEREDLVASMEQHVFTLKNWFEARGIDNNL
jgi:hypothetical protein